MNEFVKYENNLPLDKENKNNISVSVDVDPDQPAHPSRVIKAENFILLPFAVIGGCAFVILPVICIILPHQEDCYDVLEDSPSIRTVCFHPKSVVNSISLFVAASFCTMLNSTLEPYLRMFTLKPAIVGILFLIMAALYPLTSLLWGWLAKKLPDKRVIVVVGFLLATVSLLVLGTSPVLGFKSNFHDLGYHDDNQACWIISGLLVSMYALGAFAGQSFRSYLLETIGFQWLVTWFSAACLVVIVLVGAVCCVEVKCRKHPSADSLPLMKRQLYLGRQKTNYNTTVGWPHSKNNQWKYKFGQVYNLVMVLCIHRDLLLP